MALANSVKKINIKRHLPIAIIGFALLATLLIVGNSILSKASASSRNTNSKVEVAAPRAILSLNKEQKFPLKDSTGKTITELKFNLENIEERDEIIVKGSRATAVKGRVFLVMTLKLTSEFTKALQVNTKDYFRLTINDNNTEMLAPDIHNDPVIVEPTSTKYTRLGWSINESDKNIILHIGEIGSQKTSIEINFSN